MRNRKIKADVSLHEALEEIRQQVADNKPTSYTKKGCRVSMADLPSERVVLDVDLAFPTDKADTNRCDFILFYIDPDQISIVGVPMELKGGDVDASEAIAQLREGARIVDNFAPRNVAIDLVLVLVHADGIHKAQFEKLRDSRIRFRGEDFPINTTKCSYQGNLAQALAKSIKR